MRFCFSPHVNKLGLHGLTLDNWSRKRSIITIDGELLLCWLGRQRLNREQSLKQLRPPLTLEVSWRKTVQSSKIIHSRVPRLIQNSREIGNGDPRKVLSSLLFTASSASSSCVSNCKSNITGRVIILY